MSGFVPRRPDFRLVVVDRNRTKHRLEAGIAYENKAGGFNLRLNPGVVLRWNDEVYLTLWPEDGLPARKKTNRPERQEDVERAALQEEFDPPADETSKGSGGGGEDGIPF